jgi:hypothetical protein
MSIVDRQRMAAGATRRALSYRSRCEQLDTASERLDVPNMDAHRGIRCCRDATHR